MRMTAGPSAAGRAGTLAFGLTVMLATSLIAQSAGDQAALRAWSDSLSAISAVPQLSRLESSSHAQPDVGGLREVLYALRLGELSHEREPLQRAVTAASQIADVHSSWPWAPFLLAKSFALLDLGGWKPLKPDDSRAPEERYSDATWRLLGSALRIDPDFMPARRALFRWLAAGGDRLLTTTELRLVRTEIDHHEPLADALIVWGRDLRMQRRYDSALALFHRAGQVGGDPSTLALERARTLRALHDSTGAVAAYWDGVANLTPAGRDFYRYDLAWIVSADSLKSFDDTPTVAVATWLHRFWAQRDAEATNAPGQRLSEHLRRWVVAYARYRVRSPWRRSQYKRIDPFFENDDCIHLDKSLYDLLWHLPPSNPLDLRNDEWLLDHRGIMYLRHGEPLLMSGGFGGHHAVEDFSSGPPSDQADFTAIEAAGIRSIGTSHLGSDEMAGPPRMMPARVVESWLYLMGGQPQIVSFRNSDAIGNYAATTVASVIPYSHQNPAAFLRLARVTPAFAAAAQRILADQQIHYGPGGNKSHMDACWREIQAVDSSSRQSTDLAARSDTDEPPFLHRWRSTIQMFALGDGTAPASSVLLTFALGADSIRADTLPDGRYLYSLHYHAVAINRADGRTVTVDTVRSFTRPAPMGAADWLVSWLSLPITAGGWEVAVRVQQGDSSGAYAIQRDVEVGAARIALSDVVLGKNGEPQWTATDGQPFPLNATGRWAVGDTVRMFYEVHGIPAGAAYRTTMQWKAVGPKSPSTVTLAVSDVSSGSTHMRRRSFALQSRPPGTYDLVLTVEYAGQRVSRSQRIVVAPSVPKGRGGGGR
jgi:hypothetical protein